MWCGMPGTTMRAMRFMRTKDQTNDGRSLKILTVMDGFHARKSGARIRSLDHFR
jgi:hypothetical protein